MLDGNMVLDYLALVCRPPKDIEDEVAVIREPA
jgi:hypothetical protein